VLPELREASWGELDGGRFDAVADIVKHWKAGDAQGNG